MMYIMILLLNMESIRFNGNFFFVSQCKGSDGIKLLLNWLKQLNLSVILVNVWENIQVWYSHVGGMFEN